MSNLVQSNFSAIKSLMNNNELKRRFQEILAEQAPSFMASVINVVNGNETLKACNPQTVWGAAMIAASLKLPVDPNLSFAYIIPYRDKEKGYIAQFQIGYKGLVQLAMRSGQYRKMSVSEVYKDELKSYNPITEEIEFTDPSTWKMRDEGKYENIVGYYAFFELINGYRKEVFWTVEKIKQHAQHYSQSYRKGIGVWKENFDAMAKKTVLKNLLSKWGILSIEMQKAIEKDQIVYDAEKEEETYIDNQPVVLLSREQKEELMQLAKGKQEEAMKILNEMGYSGLNEVQVEDFEKVKEAFQKLGGSKNE